MRFLHCCAATLGLANIGNRRSVPPTQSLSLATVMEKIMSQQNTADQMNLFSSTVPLTQAEIDRAVRMAHTLRAITFAASIVAAGAAVIRGVRHVATAITEARAKARTRTVLSSLSARELADIGLTHSDINAVVDGFDPLKDVRGPAAALPTAPLIQLIEKTAPRVSASDDHALAA